MSGVARPLPTMRVGRLVRYATAIAVSLLFLIPLLLCVNGALKPPAEISNVLLPPSGVYLDNFRQGWGRIGAGLINSLLITIPAVALSILVGSLAAYPLSRMGVRQSRPIFLLLLSGMFVPYQIVQIPVFTIMARTGLYNTIPGLWLVHIAYGIPVCTFFMRNYFVTMPKSMYEAAQIDGCSPTSYFFRILMPAALPGLAALAIVQSRAVWNDLLFAMTLTSDDRTMPVTAALNGFVSSTEVQYGPLMASAIISVAPMIIIFLAFQKAFIRGLLGGSSK